jgi:hypothetical protein
VGCISQVHTFYTINLQTRAYVARRPSVVFTRFLPVAGILHDIRPHLTAHAPVCASKLLINEESGYELLPGFRGAGTRFRVVGALGPEPSTSGRPAFSVRACLPVGSS